MADTDWKEPPPAPELPLHMRVVMATVDGARALEELHRECDLLAARNRKAVRRALQYLIEVQDPRSRNLLFCFLWEKSGHPWDIPVTMTTIRG